MSMIGTSVSEKAESFWYLRTFYEVHISKDNQYKINIGKKKMFDLSYEQYMWDPSQQKIP